MVECQVVKIQEEGRSRNGGSKRVGPTHETRHLKRGQFGDLQRRLYACGGIQRICVPTNDRALPLPHSICWGSSFVNLRFSDLLDDFMANF